MKIFKEKFFKNTFLYLLGSILPMAFGFIRSPIFTRYFTPDEYGYYSIVFVTYGIISVFLYSWLSSGIWRFYNMYKNKKELNVFFSNVFFLFFLFSLLFSVTAVIWHFSVESSVMKNLTVLVFLQTVVSSMVNFILIVFKIEQEAFKYNITVVIKSIISFLIQYFLTFQMRYRIEAIPVSTLLIETGLLIFLLPGFLKKFSVSKKNISFSVIKQLVSYAFIGIVTGLGVLILSSSDRYVIAVLSKMENVGIYNQVYNLSKVSIMAMVLLFFSIINPVLTKELENNINGTNRLLSTYISTYIIAILPITVYLSCFALPLANILLGEKFRVGYKMIPFVMFSSFFYGVILFFEARLKFSSQYKQIIKGFLAASGLNIVMNFIFIPIFNYQWAAFTTLVSYIFLLFVFLKSDKKEHPYLKMNFRVITPSLITLFIQVLIHLTLNYYFHIIENVWYIISEGLIFLIIYILIIWYFNKQILIFFKRISDNFSTKIRT